MPEIPPEVAVIVVVPMFNGVAWPSKPGVLLMLATNVFEEDHWTAVVMFFELLSVKFPVAEN